MALLRNGKRFTQLENGARKIKLISRRIEPATDYQKAIGVNPPPIGYVYEFEKSQRYLSLFLKLNLRDPVEFQSLLNLLDPLAELFSGVVMGGKRRYYEEQQKLRVFAEKPAVTFDGYDWATINSYVRQMTISIHYGRPLRIAPGFVILLYFQLAMEKVSEQYVKRTWHASRLPENCDACTVKNCPAYRSSEFFNGVPDDCPLMSESTGELRQNLIEDVNLSIALQHRKAGLTRLEGQVSTLRAQGKTPAEIADILRKDRAQITRLVQSSERKLMTTHRSL